MATQYQQPPRRSIGRTLLRPLYLFYGHLKYAGAAGGMRLALALFLHGVAPAFTRLGRRQRHCPCCGWRGRNFLPYIAGGYVSFQAGCPGCGWHPRHRGHRLFYDRVIRLMEQEGRLLYFSPEESILRYMKRNDRLVIKTTDYGSKTTDFDLNIMDIPFESDTWDLVVCHRVIEHVPDDRQALRELYRILKPSGLLILSVPIYREKTVDYREPNPLEDDHYYAYGLDFEERIPAEFQTTRYAFSELFTPEEFARMALTEDYVYLCEKPASG